MHQFHIQAIDRYLMTRILPSKSSRWSAFWFDGLFFWLKHIRACLFASLLFVCIWAVPKAGIAGMPRYDVLLMLALLVQAAMLWSKLETIDELKAVCVFHIVGFALEAFKVSAHIKSWSYPDFAYTKVADVPLFSGFMYAAVGSYMIQAWRLFDLKIINHPPFWATTLIATLIYLNFFTQHYISDYRWYCAVAVIGLYARTHVVFTPTSSARRMPLLLCFVSIGFFVWLAENFGTFYGIWRYPHQIEVWAAVRVGKWASWSLLAVMTLAIVVNLKHIKQNIHVIK